MQLRAVSAAAAAAAAPFVQQQVPSLRVPSEGRTNLSDSSFDIETFMESLLAQDPVALNTELAPIPLAQGLGLSFDGSQGQQGSNGRRQGAKPAPLQGGREKQVQQKEASKAREAVARADDQASLRVRQPANTPSALVAAQRHEVATAAAAGAAAAQAAYVQQAQQQQQQMQAAYAQQYAQQQVQAQQLQQQQPQQPGQAGPLRSALPGPQSQAQPQAQSELQQAQAQQAAYIQAYHQQQAVQQQAAAAYGQYGGWPPNPYAYFQAQAQAAQQQYQANLQQYGAQPPYNQQGPMQQGMASPPATGAANALAAAAAAAAGGEGGASDEEGCEEARAVKRPRLIWTSALHRRFLESVEKCGGVDRALPKGIMKEMSVSGLTRENVASHLQKYRMRMKKGLPAGASHYDEGEGDAEDGGAATATPKGVQGAEEHTPAYHAAAPAAAGLPADVDQADADKAAAAKTITEGPCRQR